MKLCKGRLKAALCNFRDQTQQRISMPDPTSTIRALNDRLRSTFVGGSVLLGNGVASLNDYAKRRLLAASSAQAKVY
jgi:hypothetical protein